MSVYNVQRYPAEYFIDQICNGDCGEGGGGGWGSVPAVLGDELNNLRAYNNRNVSWES